MTMAYLAQPEQQQKLEWLDGGTFSVLLDKDATEGQLTVGRFDVAKGEAPPFHLHTREDEVFMLILMIATPGGIEGMFRHAGRDLATPRPDGFEIPASLLQEASELYGNVIVGPPR